MTTAATSQQIATPDDRRSGLAVAVQDVAVSFPASDGRLRALDGCSLEVAAGSFTVIIGPNGCGKSTLLRVIAGLLQPDAGRVLIGEANAASSPRPGDPRVGLAFQQPRLLPWLASG
jgi:ABC-type sugar transport system ATPase subunit